MTLMIRLTRLLSADLHALMDRLEEPHALLAQAQREMEETLATDRARLAQLERDGEQIECERGRLDEALRACETELDLCFAEGNDVLARKVLKRRLQSEAQLLELDHEHQQFATQARALRERIEREAQALAEVATEAERLHARARDNNVAARPGVAGASVSDEAVELALLAARRARGLAS
ncbi:MAG: PspA/IM30 family protein [Pseudomonadota bacterium]